MFSIQRLIFIVGIIVSVAHRFWLIALFFILMNCYLAYGDDNQILHQQNDPISLLSMSPEAIPVLTPQEANAANEEALTYHAQINIKEGEKSFNLVPQAIPVLSVKDAQKANIEAISFHRNEKIKQRFIYAINSIGLNKNRLSLIISMLPLLFIADCLFKKKCNSVLTKKYLSFQRRVYVISAVTLFLFGLIVFVPWNIYFGNSSQFSFIFQDFVNESIYVLIFSIVLISLILLAIPPKVSDHMVAIIGALGVCVYVQSMFMNCFLGQMNGTEQEWNQHFVWGCVNLLIWIIIVLIPIVLVYLKKKLPQWSMILSLTNTFVFIIELIAVLSMVISSSANVWKRTNDYFVDGTLQFHFSKQKNVIVLIFDQLGGGLVEPCIKADPHLKNDLKDFTWYTDARGSYSSTFPAMLTEITGTYVKPADDLDDLMTTTWNSPESQSFYSQIHKAGFNSRIYIQNFLVIGYPKYYHSYFSNIHEEKIQYIIDYKKLCQCIVKLSGFSSMPYFLKKEFFYGDDFSNDVVQQKNGSLSPHEADIPWRNDRFFTKLSQGIVVDDDTPVFSIHYSRGPHAPRCVDEKCQYHEPYYEDLLPGARSCFYILSNLIKQLKENGIYDQTEIVVFSDHHCRDKQYDSKFLFITLMIKPFNSKQNEMTKIDKRIHSVDIAPSLLWTISGDEGNYDAFSGYPFPNLPSSRELIVYGSFNHPDIPQFRDFNGSPMDSNCFKEYILEPGTQYPKIIRYIPWKDQASVDESILNTILPNP